jgi:hypothetical protein
MGPAVYVMAILGCGEASELCEPVATLPARYESAAECNAATEDAIQRHSAALYPVIVAECRAAGTPITQKIWADEIKLPEAPQTGPRIQSANYKQQRPRS